MLTLADVHDVPVVIINGQGIERKGFLQIVPGARTSITSKNGYFGNFRTDPGRSPSIPRVPQLFPPAVLAQVFRR